MYKFAELFTEEPRQYAASLTYDMIDHSNDIPEPRAYIDNECYCPIGAILKFCGGIVPESYRHHANAPAADVAWDILQSARCATRPGDYQSIAGFIKSWDQGKITDLAEALGV
jgi:hypothetical protein